MKYRLSSGLLLTLALGLCASGCVNDAEPADDPTTEDDSTATEEASALASARCPRQAKCFTARGDRPRGKDKNGGNLGTLNAYVSAHGWWDKDNSTATEALVEAQLWVQQDNKQWKPGSHAAEGTFPPGPGKGREVSTREPCSSQKLRMWKVIVKVKLVGPELKPSSYESGEVPINCDM